ncbi:MAG TPA: flagellar biosynthesis protein FlhF [Planctomycetaceae bacterium]|nr:flagellar biosynthesis protein FlhF [Planctomycetaceae bacterium]
MTADVRTFKAASLQAALEIVRTELGPDAVILHTRQLEARRLFPWPTKRTEVEVTAGRGVSGDASPRVTVSASTTIAARSTVEELAPPPELLPSSRTTPTSPRHNVAPPRWSPNDVIPDDEPVAKPTASRLPKLVTPPAPTQKTPIPPPPMKSVVPDTIAARSRLASTDQPRGDSLAIQQRLDTLQRMILDLGRERSGHALHDVPAELFPLYTRLVEAEVEDDLARELVCRAKERASKGQLADPNAMLSLVTAHIEQELRPAPPITAVRGRRKVVALVGPTGVGKTTTLAKLAANFRLRDGLRVGLVTVDTYRVAAVEQLRTYAELIDLPMKVVTQPSEMPRALNELAGLDLVLIDTAGRSPRDDVRIQELRDVLEAAAIDEVHLVLSLASGLPALKTAAANFQSVGVTSIMLTKLDEATGCGPLLPIARQLKTPVSYLTTGQNVPDDIEPAQRTRMARLILGLEQIGTMGNGVL